MLDNKKRINYMAQYDTDSYVSEVDTNTVFRNEKYHSTQDWKVPDVVGGVEKQI